MGTHYDDGADIVDVDISQRQERPAGIELQDRNVRGSSTTDLTTTDALLSEWSPRFRGSGIESPDTLVDSRSLAFRRSGIESIPDTLVYSRSATPLSVCPLSRASQAPPAMMRNLISMSIIRIVSVITVARVFSPLT